MRKPQGAQGKATKDRIGLRVNTSKARGTGRENAERGVNRVKGTSIKDGTLGGWYQ